jgi:hypothetical protein
VDRRSFLAGGLVMALGETLRVAATEADALEAAGKSCQAELQAARAEVARLQAELDACLAPGIKPLATGLATSGFSSPYYTPQLKVATLNAYWDQIEPSRGTFTDWLPTQLDAAPGIPVRIRPFFGSRAPAWMKDLGDGPIAYTEPQGGTQHTVPDIWSPEYIEAVQGSLDHLAKMTDDDERVALVFATAGMLAFGEPFIRGMADAGNRSRFLDAGYTATGDKALELWQIDAMRGWTRTRIGLAYNPWQFIRADGTAGTDLGFTAQVMDYHIAVCGERTVLTNHSIRSSYIAGPPPLYGLFLERPEIPHQFQTAAAERIGDLRATLDWGIDYLDASCIEVFPGAWNVLTASEIAEYDARLGNP